MYYKKLKDTNIYLNTAKDLNEIITTNPTCLYVTYSLDI